MKLINKVIITCKETAFLLTKKEFEKITFSESLKLKLHLILCKYCRIFDAQIKKIIENFEKDTGNSELSIDEKADMIKKLK